MMRRKAISRAAFTALAVVALAAMCQRAAADTIVLKNGRRIIAFSVVVEGDKVRYQTSAGELTLPKSIVDHIEKGGAAGGSGGGAANLGISAPAVELTTADRGGGEVERLAVHDGSVDREYIAKAEGEAR